MSRLGEGLNEKQIRDYLLDDAEKHIGTIYVFNEVDSTNTWLLANGKGGDVCLSEQQTAGRGRRGNQWYSPDQQNIYFSLKWQFDTIPANLSCLPLLVGISIAEALQQTGINQHAVKWPNDLYYQDKKLGGILIENQGNMKEWVIGIGLNINMSSEEDVIDQPWVSVSQIIGQPCNRNQIIARILAEILPRLNHFNTLNFERFLLDWDKWDYLKNKQVSIHQNSGILYGKAEGIDQQGCLLVRLPDQQLKTFSSADVSVRA